MTHPRSSGTLTSKRERFGADNPRTSEAADLGRPASLYHAVRFYEDDDSLARIVAPFLIEGFAAGSSAVIIATDAQRAALVRELSAAGVDVVALQREQHLLLLGAEATLARFMINGNPDPRRFREQMSQAIATVCRGPGGPVRLFGQMVDILWQRGQPEAAIRLEVLWNQLAHIETFSLLCGYAFGHFYKEAGADDICRQHSHVIGAGGEALATPKPE
jgi:hypothetical protein